MKSDENTGFFTLVNGERLGPSTTRSEFLLSPLGRSSKVLIKNEPWCSFRFTVPEETTSFAAYFKGEILDSIHITVVGAEYGKDWNDWSEEKEMARKLANDKWLMSVGLTPGAQYPWGSVWSGYDPKGGFSSAVVRYVAGS